ncbi:MAG: DUF11 domain-containing protein [Saprospiraceae bacterium]|nr:DUF11 domain-containing protein [Saprospiraceae bacterium]
MMASPGAANSEKNAALIAGLFSCLEGEEDDTDDGDVPVPYNPGIIVSKTADVTSMNQPGDVITYTITVTNTGNSVLTNVVVSDPLTQFTNTIPALLPCESRTFTTKYEVSCEELANINGLSNTATATGTTMRGDNVQSESTAHVANGTILLSIEKEVSNALPPYGAVVTFSLTLRNEGAATATGVSVKDLFPQSGYADITNISHGGVLGTPVNGEVNFVWSGLTVPAGGTLTLTFDATVLENGAYTNCALIQGSDQYNVYAAPCSDDEESKEHLYSCVELTPQGNVCELGVTTEIIAYDPEDFPNDPSDDTYTVSILVTTPEDTPGNCWKFTLGGIVYSGLIDVASSFTFPVGTNWEGVTVGLYMADCQTAVLCSAVFNILSPAAVGNFAWIDKNRDGLQNNNEEGASGLSVTLLQNQTAVATTTTGADGEYLFTNLAPGEYQVAFALPPNPTELVHSINFNTVSVISAAPTFSGADGFSISLHNGATGMPQDRCARSFYNNNNYLSFQQTLSADYEYRIRWNVKSGATDPAVQKIMQLRHSTTAGAAGTDIGTPFILPQIAPTQPGHEYAGEWFGGLSGVHHLILTTAPGNSTSGGSYCYFDDFRLERRLVSGHPNGYVPTLQNVDNDDAIDSDINYAVISDVFSLTPGQIRMDIDAGFVQGAFPALRSDTGPALSAPDMPASANVETISAPTQDTEDMLVYPNPFAEYCRLKLSSSLSGDALISIYSPLSQQVIQTRVELRPGDTDTELPLPPRLPAGVYIVKVQFPSGSVLSRMMTKIRI